jgi:hypothetical protein
MLIITNDINRHIIGYHRNAGAMQAARSCAAGDKNIK